jgi:hypothetical protein
VVRRLLFLRRMSVGSFRQAEDSDQGAVGQEWLGGGGGAGKRAPTDAIQRKADGTAPPPTPTLATPARDDTPAPTSGQSFVDSIVHGPVDSKKVAEEQIAHGVHDENTITNEVFWALRPAQRGDHLKPGSADAKEWLRLRDEIVRPAMSSHKSHETHHAAPKTAPEVGGGELAKNTHAETPRTDSVQPSGDAAIDELLAAVPPNGSSNKIDAAWLIKALGTKLFGASETTLGQLKQLANGETALRTRDGTSGGDAIKRGLANLEKQKIHASQVDANHYVVDGGHLPILGAMVDLGAGRIRQWVKEGMKNKRQLFYFGDMVRADVDYAGEKTHSAHTSGNAIDLGGMNFNSEADVVSVLSGLEPKKINMVFPDGGAGSIVAHVHLAVTDDGKYELGIPFSPAFFQLGDSVFTRQKEAEKANPNPEEGKVIHANGLVMWHTVWYEATGVFKGGKWNWTRKASSGDSARAHIKSGALKSLLDRLHSGATGKVSQQAAKEDGVDPHAGVEKH